MSEITLYQELPLHERQHYASQIAVAAQMLPNGIRASTPDETAARAFLIMETGSMLGLHPIAALSSVNIIEGKPSMSADLMVSLMRASGHLVRIAESGTVEGGDYQTTVTVIRADDPDNPVSSTWTPHRAARAGLCRYAQDPGGGLWRVTASAKSGSALPWQLYTEALCKARAKSEAARDGGSDVLHGVRYTAEELGAETDAAGDPIITSMGGPAAADAPTSAALPPATKRATTGKQGTRRRKTADQAAAEEPAQPETIVVEPVAEATDAPVEVAAVPVEVAAPVQAVEDSEVNAERAERERMAAEQTRQVTEREARIATAADVDRADTTAVAAWNAEHGQATGHYITSEAELAAQAARLAAPEVAPAEPVAAPVPMYVDPNTGKVLETQAEVDAAAAAAEPMPYIEPTQPDDGPTPLEVAEAEEPGNWSRQIAAATTVPELKAIWMNADREKQLTNDLRLEVNNRKAVIDGAAGA